MNKVKLHLGCAGRYLKGYIHIDLADYPHIDYIHDIRILPMFKDASVDLIYASHAVEYFDRVEITEVLKEWYRVLRVGGILRLAVPDFDALIKAYLKYKDITLILGPLYGRWQPRGRNLTIYHKTVYDYSLLKGLLESIGFKSIRRWNWRDVFTHELKGFDDYSQAYIPHMKKDNGILISLNLEGQK